jgi:hypothetical protein
MYNECMRAYDKWGHPTGIVCITPRRCPSGGLGQRRTQVAVLTSRLLFGCQGSVLVTSSHAAVTTCVETSKKHAVGANVGTTRHSRWGHHSPRACCVVWCWLMVWCWLVVVLAKIVARCCDGPRRRKLGPHHCGRVQQALLLASFPSTPNDSLHHSGFSAMHQWCPESEIRC